MPWRFDIQITMEHEREVLAIYKELLSLMEGKFVMLEDYADD